MDRNWDELAWLEWMPPEAGRAHGRGYQRIGSVRPEALAKVMLMLLRWETQDRSIFRVVTESGVVIAGGDVEAEASEAGFPFRLPQRQLDSTIVPIRS